MVTKIWPIRMFFVTFHSLAVSKLFSFWILNCVITSGRTYESGGAPSPRVSGATAGASRRGRRGGGAAGGEGARAPSRRSSSPLTQYTAAARPGIPHATMPYSVNPSDAQNRQKACHVASSTPYTSQNATGAATGDGCAVAHRITKTASAANCARARGARGLSGRRAGAQRRGGARTISRLADGCANRPSSSQLELEYGVASGKAAPADMTAGARGRGAGRSGSRHSSSRSQRLLQLE